MKKTFYNANKTFVMKRILILLVASNFLITVNAQKESNNKYLSLALFNTENAKPFGMFTELIDGTYHPGIEAGYGNNFSIQEHHEWFVELKLAYFYHRYVQHGIPLYLNFGYRYRFNDHLSAETSIGAGYMQSIPATAKLRLNDDGEYVKNKGVGRAQAIATFSLGLGYTPNPFSSHPIRIFTAWQQRAQMPFVKSYVPVLPYNSFMMGVSRTLKSK
jgi:hypothetical protein